MVYSKRRIASGKHFSRASQTGFSIHPCTELRLNSNTGWAEKKEIGMKSIAYTSGPPPEAGQLAQIGLFRGLNAAQLSQIQEHLQARVFPPGAVFIHQGQSGDGLYFLARGAVKVFLALGKDPAGESAVGESPVPDAGEAVIAVCTTGETLGEIDLADGRGHTASVAALEESHLWWMASADFWYCHNVVPQLGRNLCRLLARRMRGCTAAHDVLTTLHLPGKIAFHLLLLARDHGHLQPDGSVLLSLPLSQSEMGSLVGASREQVNRVLTRFARQGCIQRRDKHWLIRDAAALRRHCEGRLPALGVPKLS
jgi:CRP-like cAMP-binding protein